MSTNLVTLEDGKAVQLPPAQHKGATALWQRAERLPGWLPSGVNPHQFMLAVTAEANKRELADCTPASVVTAAFNCAVLGLLPGSVLGHAYFVPFKTTAQLIVGYKGFIDLAYGCDFLADVQCDVVLRGEKYRRWNNAEGACLEHELPIDRDETWGNVTAAYCIWHSRSGGRGVCVVPRKALEALKRRGNVWNTDTLAMCLKTPLRRSANRWKLTQRMGAAVTLDALAEAGKPQPALAGDSDDQGQPPSLDSFDAEPEAGTKADADLDEAQQLDEYREEIGRADTVLNVIALEETALAGNLSDDGKSQVSTWCESQRLAIRQQDQDRKEQA